MGNGTGKVYLQANTGYLKNADDAIYSNMGATLGAKGKIPVKGNSAIFGQAEVGAGTALTGNVELGYEKNLGKNSELIFSANAAYNSSLTDYESVTSTAKASLDINGQQAQAVAITAKTWNPGNIKFSGKIGYNKKTSWGEYETGVETGYRKALSPEINVKNTAIAHNDDMNATSQATAGIKRKPKEGAFVTPYGSVKVNLDKKGKFQAMGKADLNEAKIGINYNF